MKQVVVIIVWAADHRRRELSVGGPTVAANLWAPLPGDHGAQGRFAARSTRSSPQTWANEHAAIAVGLAIGAATLLWSARKS
jgi:hypothetical protein